MVRKPVAVLSRIIALPMSFLTVGCASPGTGTASPTATTMTSPPPAASTTTSPSPAAAPSGDLCGPGSVPTFNRRDFPDKPKVDNEWMPLVPGRHFVLNGTVTDTSSGAAELHERRVESTVTGLTKVIDGVRTIVLWDRDFADGTLKESELAFFAQSENGAVWLLGEYPEEFEAGTFAGAPSTFISGVDGAQTGFAMQAQPLKGPGPYLQASAPSIGFLDVRGWSPQTGASACPRDAMTTFCRSTSPVLSMQPPAISRSSTPPALGLRSHGEQRRGPGVHRSLRDHTINESDLAKINEQAMALDPHGYTVSPGVYGTTTPARVHD